MILILSTDWDASTHNVTDWLTFQGVKHLVITPQTHFVITRFQFGENSTDFTLTLPNHPKKKVKFSELTGFWYRRGQFALNSHIKGQNAISNFIRREATSILDPIYNLLKKMPNGVGDFLANSTNKIENLLIAKSVGLTIPETLITNDLKNLNPAKKYITKSAWQVNSFNAHGFTVFAGTERVKEREGDSFFPTLFQEEIKKQYELRIFYFREKLFASAIFSQLSTVTEVDFRKDNGRNRIVPFKLPTGLSEKLTQFMKRIQLNCGAIDMIVSEEGRFYFLEVNPIGQFEYYGFPCNYYLNKFVANELSNGQRTTSSYHS